MKRILSLFVVAIFVTSCGMQSIPRALNDVEAKWAEVENQYKRRSDLIPNLVQVVKGYAKDEKETLSAVISARANATKVTIDASKVTPEGLAKYSNAQGALTSALSKLMMVSERYPNLKADQNFRDLQHQLEGTENRITVARNRYISSIKVFNDLVTVPPTSWYNSLFLHRDKRPQFKVENLEKIKHAPQVKF